MARIKAEAETALRHMAEVQTALRQDLAELQAAHRQDMAEFYRRLDQDMAEFYPRLEEVRLKDMAEVEAARLQDKIEMYELLDAGVRYARVQQKEKEERAQAMATAGQSAGKEGK